MKQPNFDVQPLDFKNKSDVKACISLLSDAFVKSERYKESRIAKELRPLEAPYYRQFFVAKLGNKIVGVAGIKSADWASQTHIFYLAAVNSSHRGLGIGRLLIQARMVWLKKNFTTGRALVSSTKFKRFNGFGFKTVAKSKLDERYLLQHVW